MYEYNYSYIAKLALFGNIAVELISYTASYVVENELTA